MSHDFINKNTAINNINHVVIKFTTLVLQSKRDFVDESESASTFLFPFRKASGEMKNYATKYQFSTFAASQPGTTWLFRLLSLIATLRGNEEIDRNIFEL